jgi:hypothetical protein
LGENVRGALGFVNPLLSMAINTSRAGIDQGFATHYGTQHTASDVYGDLILSGRRREPGRAVPATHEGGSAS